MSQFCGYLAANIRVAANLTENAKRQEWRARWHSLQLRAESIGATLAGQNNDEGVIDRAGNFHDIAWEPGDEDNEEFRFRAVSAVLDRLGA